MIVKTLKNIPFFLLFSILSYAEPIIVAHRGASKDAPENTIPAFELAWKQGADAIEADFFLTKDNRIVCIHDKNTKKLANKELIIKQAIASELRTLDVGTKHSPQFKGITIPLISEVFATIPPKKKIYIEIKCGIEIIPYLLEEIDRSGLTHDQIIIICFNPAVLKTIKLQAPHYKTLWLCKIKSRLGKLIPSQETILTTLKEIKADGFSSNKDNINTHTVKQIVQHGYEYHAWTIDNPTTAKYFSSLGAKSITTNVPAVIKHSLSTKSTK